MNHAQTTPELLTELEKAHRHIHELEKALERSSNAHGDEERLAQVLELLPVGISILDTERNVVFQNSALSGILNMTAEGLQSGLYKNRKYVSANGSPMPADGFASAQAEKSGQAVYDVETGIILENGETIWTNVSAVPMDFPDWKMVIVTTDINERKRLETNLRDSENKYMLLFQKSTIPVVLLKLPEVVIADANEATEKLTGFSRDEMLGRTATELGIISQKQRTEAITEFQKERMLAENERAIITKSSEERIVITNTNPLDLGGKPYAITSMQDITERKRMERENARLTERFELATHAAGIGVWDWDIQKNEIVWDDQMYSLYGILPGGFGGAYEAWLHGVHPDDRESSNEISAAAVRGEHEYDTEFRVVWPDGSVHWLKANGQVFRDEQGNPTRMVGVNYDITARKQAEETLQTLTNLLNDGQRIAHMGSFEYDAKTKRTVWSEEECRIYGYDPAQPSPDYETMLVHSIHPADADLLHRTFLAAMQNGTVYELEHRIVQPNGSVRWVYDRAHPYYDKHGQLLRYVGVTHDITERKAAEQKIRENEEFLRLAYEAADLGILKNDLQTGSVEFDERARIHYGFDTLHTTLAEVTSRVHPEDVARLGSEIAAATAPTGSGKFSTEYRVLHSDGSVHWLDVRVRVTFEEGGEKRRSLMGYGTSMDITERKQAEEKMRRRTEELEQLLDMLPEAVWIAEDPECKIIRGNRYANQMLEVSSTDNISQSAEAPARVLRQFSHGRELAPDELPMQMAVKTGLPQVDYELRIEQAGKLPRILLGGAVPLFDSNGKTRGAVAGFHDITERKRTEDDLRRSNAELEQFAYVASHDLQEPLRTVAGMVQLLQQRYQGQLDERADEYIRFAVDASDRMQQLINDLLDFSRVDRKGRSFEMTQMKNVLQAAISNLRVAIEKSGAQITFDTMPTVQADAGQLTLVIQNLLSNAIKFRGEKPPKVHISAEKVGNVWQFAVSDNGIGIDPQYFERVFLLFQRLHTRKQYPGTGIGLALCKKIIERHGGKMWIQSELSHGATFFFTIPERT